ncbi:unnamed protein product [Symbiodinium pilosum]|uniref:Uncharacterized protein n=1 Tax=Symbiodinium pilosum TaxID=2952 RepID=A0A812TSR6_SYMPI|nr:unnamed protein product [Symbiodinium pilosum]
MAGHKWMPQAGNNCHVVFALFNVVLCCRILQHSEAAMHWVQLVQLLVFLAAGLGLSKLASASFVPVDIVYSAFAFLAISYCDYARSNPGTVPNDTLLLAQLMLISSGTRASVLMAWTAGVSASLHGRALLHLESFLLLWCGFGMHILSGQAKKPQPLTDGEHNRLQFKKCLQLVLQQIRVPLQLAQSDLDCSNATERVRARLQQIWELLSGLDGHCSKQLESAIAKELGLDSDGLSPPGQPQKVLGSWSELDREIARHEHRHREGSPESSTTFGSGSSNEGRWESLPEYVSLQLTVDLEGESMPVTEVKLCLGQQLQLSHFLPSESDWQEFRNWLEPEVNRAIHMDGYLPDSTAIPLILPTLLDGHRLNAGAGVCEGCGKKEGTLVARPAQC